MPHRRVDMSYGSPEEEGLRCMYHGWMFDETGQCVEQPFEETVHSDGRFKEKIKINAYPVETMGGMVFTYMRPPACTVAPIPAVSQRRPEPYGSGLLFPQLHIQQPMVRTLARS